MSGTPHNPTSPGKLGYDGAVLRKRLDPRCDPVRRTLGHTRRYAGRTDLARALPRGDLASTGYCLADPAKEYLVHLPEGGRVTVDFSAAVGSTAVECFDAGAGAASVGEPVAGGGERAFVSPCPHAAVLHLTVVRE